MKSVTRIQCVVRATYKLRGRKHAHSGESPTHLLSLAEADEPAKCEKKVREEMIILSSSLKYLDHWLCSTVGGTPVFGRRTGPVLRSACSRRVTTMWVNRPIGLQVSQLGQLNLSSFRGR